MIAVLGTGLLGTGFTRAFLKRGETVHVWNRTPARAPPLAAEGAKVFEHAADAVRDTRRIHLLLSDDAAVEAVLDAAQPVAATWVFDHSTTSTRGVLDRTARFRAAGITYQHAPVFMGPQNAAESTGLMLISGDRATVERAKPLLAPMTGKLVELGERVDAAAAFKLMGNLFLMALTAGCADMLALAKAMHVPAAEAATLFDHFNPGTTIGSRIKRMTEAQFAQPSWELAMARKDARLMQEEADAAQVALALLPAIAARMDTVIAEGHGALDWTVIAKDFV
jgi:3-hydroxyisobutyrate dehydrogenase